MEKATKAQVGTLVYGTEVIYLQLLYGVVVTHRNLTPKFLGSIPSRATNYAGDPLLYRRARSKFLVFGVRPSDANCAR